MKIESYQTHILGTVPSVGSFDAKKTKSKDKEGDRLQNTAFVELKKANQQIAKLQALGVSFDQIQKELGELESLDHQAQYQNTQQNLIAKIQNLQAKLSPLLNEAKHFKIRELNQISSDQVSNMRSGVEKIQVQIKDLLKKTEQEIEDFFHTQQEVGFDEKKLKHPSFKNAHNTEHLSSSFRDLIA